VLGKAIGIGGVFGDRQVGIVVENAAENITGLTRRAGDGLSAVDAVLIGGVGIKLQGAVVVAEIARVDAAKQAFPLDGEALAIGRGTASVTPDGTEFVAVMMVDQDGIGGLERGVAQEPSAGVLQRIGGERVDALAHGGEAEIGAMRDQGREQ
jgi:hypothetical protein